MKRTHKNIMLLGTGSNVGKSIITAGLCRIFYQDGYSVAPFKSQNMALNSFITKDGKEMGRAQVVQAEAANIEPESWMNPILLKPTTDRKSQVIVNGKVYKNMDAREYFAYKHNLKKDIMKAYSHIRDSFDICVLEGAGSPAEINLKEDDIVNTGMAEMADAPVILVADIDRGGVFASIYGTIKLLLPHEQERIRGVIINKFRGDKTLLEPGIEMIEELTGVPVLGVVPYVKLGIEEEDSLGIDKYNEKKEGKVRISVIKLKHISNFTDIDALSHYEDVSLKYVEKASDLGNEDIIIIPGSKNTIEDMKDLIEKEINTRIVRLAKNGTVVFGICGGFQMLGESIADPFGIEQGMDAPGMGLLPIQTTLTKEKTRLQVTGTIDHLSGVWSCLNGSPYEGYEIHMGKSTAVNASSSKEKKVGQSQKQPSSDLPTVVCSENGMVCGSYVHGLFDEGDLAWKLVKMLADKKNVTLEALQSGFDYKKFQEAQYDLLADTIRQHMAMDFVYSILREAKI